MAISVTDPISLAMNRAKLVTFQPFSIGKWFALGFCAFLASLDEGGGGGNFNVPNGGGGGGPRAGGAGRGGGSGVAQPTGIFYDATSWVSAHVLETAVIAGVLVLLFLSIMLLLLWLSSRGKFMFIDGVAKNTAEVVAPWKRYRRLANSFFRFRVCLLAIWFIAVVVIAGLSLLLAWHDIQAKSFGTGALASIIVGCVLLLPALIIFGLIDWCARTFVIVIMYARDTTVGPAWREFRQRVLAGNVGSLILFLLMTIVLSIAVGLGRMLLGCVTLCIGFLPYLSSVVALPLEVFMRSYSIYFLQQFGPEYAIMSEPPPRGFGFPVIMPPPPLPPWGSGDRPG